MNKSELKTWNIKKLKETAQELFSSIYILECYGINDLTLYDWVLDELSERGYEAQDNNKLTFVREGA